MKYVGKFLPATAEVCKPLKSLTSVKEGWTWYSMYLELYEKVKAISKDVVCRKSYNEKELLYTEKQMYQM